MYDSYFTFRSVTSAQRGQIALERSGLRSRLLRSPSFLSLAGCGYALKVRGGSESAAAAALGAYGVPYSGLYRVRAEGSAEEVRRL